MDHVAEASCGHGTQGRKTELSRPIFHYEYCGSLFGHASFCLILNVTAQVEVSELTVSAP